VKDPVIETYTQREAAKLDKTPTKLFRHFFKLFGIVSNPEFLREGSAVYDTFNPDRIVLGSNSEQAISMMQELYAAIVRREFAENKSLPTVPVVVTDLTSAEMIKYAAQISVVLQDSVLFAASVRDNIAYGDLNASDKDIEQAARLANAHDFIMKLPFGYNTVLGERGSTLSGGQRQRIAIARAAVRQSPIVILDEPTTGLDQENEHAVNEALDRLTQGRTTFTVSHNLKAVQNSDLIVYIEGGEVLEKGTHEQLMYQGGRYAAMYALQSVLGKNCDRPDSFSVQV
jgi:energy-coupling factor transporter ATP-binding protein EcfA2